MMYNLADLGCGLGTTCNGHLEPLLHGRFPCRLQLHHVAAAAAAFPRLAALPPLLPAGFRFRGAEPPAQDGAVVASASKPEQ
jgi:hypothetical protein